MTTPPPHRPLPEFVHRANTADARLSGCFYAFLGFLVLAVCAFAVWWRWIY